MESIENVIRAIMRMNAENVESIIVSLISTLAGIFSSHIVPPCTVPMMS